MKHAALIIGLGLLITLALVIVDTHTGYVVKESKTDIIGEYSIKAHTTLDIGDELDAYEAVLKPRVDELHSAIQVCLDEGTDSDICVLEASLEHDFSLACESDVEKAFYDFIDIAKSCYDSTSDDCLCEVSSYPSRFIVQETPDGSVIWFIDEELQEPLSFHFSEITLDQTLGRAIEHDEFSLINGMFLYKKNGNLGITDVSELVTAPLCNRKPSKQYKLCTDIDGISYVFALDFS